MGMDEVLTARPKAFRRGGRAAESTAEEGTMARPKGRPKRAAEDRPKEFQAIMVRVSTEYAEWAKRGAAHCRADMSTTVDMALVEFYRSRGFEEPPPPRY
jgi:hypothetical protein